jgi:FkbM family methyltransferase
MSSIRVLSHAFRAWRRNLRSAKHEPETPYLADLLSGAPVCLHVGASDGRHTYVMTQVAPDARIVAFEPSAFSFEVLGHCLAWHGIAGQVTKVHAAVSDAPGEMLLVTPKKGSGRMGRAYAFIAERAPEGQVRPDLEDIGVATQPTPVVTLDGWCAANGVDHVDFIRMDIEGAEQLALTGGTTILDRDSPHVLLEIHPVMLKAQFGGSAEAVIDLFLSRGYRMFALNEDSLEERTTAVPDLPWKDYFFIHPSKAATLPRGAFRTLMAA